MVDLIEFQKINPNDPNVPFKKDSFEIFKERFNEYFPSFPDDVIKEWPYRHFDDFCNRYWHLDFQCFLFKKMFFDNTIIASLKTKLSDTELKNYGNNYLNREELKLQNTWLFNYMSDHLTWPQPIIVLETNTCPLEKQAKLHKPYHLLEGHMRLAIMQAKIRSEEHICPEHEVWCVEMKAGGCNKGNNND